MPPAPKEHGNHMAAYPTEQRRRQTLRHQAANEGRAPGPKRNPQNVEQHFDECGEYFSALDVCFVESDDDECPMLDAYFGMDDSENEFEQLGDNAVAKFPDAYREFDTIVAFLASTLRTSTQPYDDVAQLCGGAGDTAALLVRRGYHEGPNYDLVAGFDLRDPDQKAKVERYVTVHKPSIMILSTPCTGMRGFSGSNQRKTHAAWVRSRRISVPLGELAARVAQLQMDGKRHFIAEHPLGSALWSHPSWKTVERYPQAVRISVDQCMTGLRGPRSGGLVKKPTEFWASDARLVKHLHALRCDGSHEHAQLDAHDPIYPSDKAKCIARWSPNFCRRLADGCETVLTEDFQRRAKAERQQGCPSGRTQKGNAQSAAPSLLTSETCKTRDTKPLGKERFDFDRDQDGHRDTKVLGFQAYPFQTCPGCRRNRIKTSQEHIRIPGECGASHIEPAVWECPACQRHLDADHPSHSRMPGKCRAGKT